MPQPCEACGKTTYTFSIDAGAYLCWEHIYQFEALADNTTYTFPAIVRILKEQFSNTQGSSEKA